MTDERIDADLEEALFRLPRGAGVIFRHYRTPPAERRRRYEQVRRIARARRLALILAGPPRQAIGWRADGAHGRSPHRRAARCLVLTAPAHNRRELMAAARIGAIAFVSPVFPTRSHPGAAGLKVVRFGLMTRGARTPVFALGGMDRQRFGRVKPLGTYGWAAIDAWCSTAPSRSART